jgi:hypothetical protein
MRVASHVCLYLYVNEALDIAGAATPYGAQKACSGWRLYQLHSVHPRRLAPWGLETLHGIHSLRGLKHAQKRAPQRLCAKVAAQHLSRVFPLPMFHFVS